MSLHYAPTLLSLALCHSLLGFPSINPLSLSTTLSLVSFDHPLARLSMDHHHSQAPSPTHRGEGEPARSRWAPKAEQILILESIFNSGMVNPAKDDTARIRRLLERFGAVRDANVFYWFQNRRSRSRRRARQLQQACGGAQLPATAGGHDVSTSAFIMHGQLCAGMSTAAAPVVPSAAASSHFWAGDVVDGGDDLFAISRQMGLMARGGDHHYSYMATDASQLSNQPTG